MQFTPAIMAAMFFVAMVLYVGFTVLLLRSSRRKPGPGRVLVVRSPLGTRVFRRGTFVFPFVHSAAELDLGDRRIEVDLTDPPLKWAGGQVTSCRVTVTIGVPDDDDRILELEQGIGSARGSDDALLSALYRETFARVIRDAAATRPPPVAMSRDVLEAVALEPLEAVTGPFEVRRIAVTGNADSTTSR